MTTRGGRVNDGRQVATRNPVPFHALQRSVGNQAISRRLHSEISGLETDRVQPLEPRVRAPMEKRFGADLSSVRVHEGQAASNEAEGVGAAAFTRGNDIFLGHRVEPNNVSVLAHEIAHVIQQTSVVSGTTLSAGQLEAEARAAAVPDSHAVVTPGAAPTGLVQRITPEELERLNEQREQQLRTEWRRLHPRERLSTMQAGSGISTVDEEAEGRDREEFQQWRSEQLRQQVASVPAFDPAARTTRTPNVTSPNAEAAPLPSNESGFTDSEGRPVQGPVTLLPSEGFMPVVQSPQPLQSGQRPEETTNVSPAVRAATKQTDPRTPEEWDRIGREAFRARTTPKERYDASLLPEPTAYIGPHEQSLLEFEQTLRMIPGARAGVPFAQVYWGEDLIGRPVDRGEALKRGTLEFAEDLTMVFGPEDLMINLGPAKGVGLGSKGATAGGRAIEEGAAIVRSETNLARETVADLPLSQRSPASGSRSAGEIRGVDSAPAKPQNGELISLEGRPRSGTIEGLETIKPGERPPTSLSEFRASKKGPSPPPSEAAAQPLQAVAEEVEAVQPKLAAGAEGATPAADVTTASLKGSKKGGSKAGSKVSDLKRHQTTEYSRFNIKARRGDPFEGHELVSNAWLEQRGFIKRRGTGLSRYNSAIAVTEKEHKVISELQRLAGLHDEAKLAKMSAREVMIKNAEILKQAGIPENRIIEILDDALEMVPKIGL